MPADEMKVELTVNGRRQEVQVAAHHTLLDALRDRLGLTGSKECCAEGECGACTIIVDGRGVNSCLMLAVEAEGSDIQTIEGLAVGDRLSPIQEAFLEHGAVQCGFCIPGMVMSAQALLSANPSPSHDEIREGLSGNLCRCGGYNQICHAVAAAAEGSGS